jgi:hypothetical protein
LRSVSPLEADEPLLLVVGAAAAVTNGCAEFVLREDFSDPLLTLVVILLASARLVIVSQMEMLS